MSAVVFPLVAFVKYSTAIASKIADSVHTPITSTPASRAAAKDSPCPAKVLKRSSSTTSLTTETVYASSSAVAVSSPDGPVPAKRVSFASQTEAEQAQRQQQEQEQEREAGEAAAAPAMLHIQPSPVPSPEMIQSMEEGVYMARSNSDPGEEETRLRGWYEPVDIKGKKPAKPRARSVSPHYAPPPIPLRRPARIRFLCKLLFAPLNILRLLWSQLQRLIYGVPTIVSDHTDPRPLFESPPDPPLMKVVVGESSGLLRRDGPARITLPHEVAHLEGPAPSPDRFIERQPAYERTSSTDSVPTRKVSPVSSPKVTPVDVSAPESAVTRVDGAELLLAEAPVLVPALPSIVDAVATNLPASRASSVHEEEVITVEVTVNIREIEEPATKVTETIQDKKAEEPEIEEPKEEIVEQSVVVDRTTVIEESTLSPIMEESETVPPTPAPQLAEIDPISKLSEDIQAAAPEVVGEVIAAEEVVQKVAEEIPEVVEKPVEVAETVVPAAEPAVVESAKPVEAVEAKVEIPVVTEEAAPIVAEEISQVVTTEPEAVKSVADIEPVLAEIVADIAAPIEAEVAPVIEAAEPAPAPAPVVAVVEAAAAVVAEPAPIVVEAKKEEEDPLKDRKPKRTWTFRKETPKEMETKTDAAPAEEKKRPLLRSLTMGMAGKPKHTENEATEAPKLEKRMSWLPKSKDSKTKSTTNSTTATGANTPNHTHTPQKPASKPPSDAGSLKEKTERRLTGLFSRKSSNKDKLERSESTSSVEQHPANTISAVTPPLLPADAASASPIAIAPNMPPTPPHSINASNAVSPAELVNKLSEVKSVEAEVAPVVAATPEKKAKARWMGVKRAMTLGNVTKKK